MVRKVGPYTLTLFVILKVYITNAAKYYVPSCAQSYHTACIYPSSGTSSTCSNRIIKWGLTNEEKQTIINLHNELRHKVASGRETRGNPGPQPSTKHMPNMEWDDEVAFFAQGWANQCNWGHDKCRDVNRFDVGQNIAYLSTTDKVQDLKVKDMVYMWYDEVQHHSNKNIARFGKTHTNDNTTGHYTQLVWANSTKIGCGAVKYKEGQFKKFYLVCNYGPAGNIFNQPVYETSS